MMVHLLFSVAVAVGWCIGVRRYMWAGIILVVLALLQPSLAHGAELIPPQARQYLRPLTREAQRAWGLDAPVARLAGQLHQESGWRADATSRYAGGLAQFTPDTATWIASAYPRDFGGVVAPYSPAWALRAVAVYDKHLYTRARGHTACDRWWFALRGYNGGAGHVAMEARKATDPLDRHSVDAACGLSRRNRTHCPENLSYPRKILLRWEPAYYAAGWGWMPPVCQPNSST